MAPHSSTLAWKIPWTEEPGGLQSMGSLRVGHDWATSLSLFTFMHWRRKWQPTPVVLLGESQGWGSLVGCHLWGHTESDMTEVMQQQHQHRHEEFFFTYGGSISLFSDRADSILRVDDGVLHPEIIYQLSHLLLRHAFSPLRASTDFS